MIEKPLFLEAINFDTSGIRPETRFAAWRSALATLDVSRSEDRPFDARAALWLLGPLVLVRASVDPVRYERSAERIGQDLKDHVAVVVLTSGGFTGAYGGDTVGSVPGSITFLDMRRPWRTDAERLDAFVLSMPRAFIMPSLEGRDPHGVVVTGPLAALLQGFLSVIVSLLPGLSRTHATTMAERIRDLVTDALNGFLREAGHVPARRDALISRVRTYVDEHLSDPLDATVLCAHLNVSRATLYRAFGDGVGPGGGGVNHLIQRRRLAALAALLADPLDERTIGEMAKSIGFLDRSFLTKAFRREYGCTPSEFRASGSGTGKPGDMWDVPLIFERWTARLD